MEDEGPHRRAASSTPSRRRTTPPTPSSTRRGDPVYVDTEIYVGRKTSEYVLSCEQTTYLIDIYAGPSARSTGSARTATAWISSPA